MRFYTIMHGVVIFNNLMRSLNEIRSSVSSNTQVLVLISLSNNN